MWLPREYCGGGTGKFFRLIFGYDTLANYYQTNFALIQHHKYSLSEIEGMIPWEKFVYLEMLMNFLKEEAERLKQQQSSYRTK